MTSVKKGNAGEWSEPYVLLKLLADGKIYDCDANLNVIHEIWHDIRSILFKTDSKDKVGSLKYVINSDESTVSVYDHGSLKIVIKRDDCNKYANGLREAIQRSKTSSGTVDIPDLYFDYLQSIGRKELKASSKETPDIWIDLPDVKNTSDKPLGFSIKSRLSSHLPTIFNSSTSSNMIYEITGPITPEIISEINELTLIHEKDGISFTYPDYSKRILKFKEYGLQLRFITAGTVEAKDGKAYFNNRTPFQRNLKMVDGEMPEILASMVLDSYFNGIKNMVGSVKQLNKKDPLHVEPSEDYPYYEKKVKDLLVAMTLSMTSAKIWDGTEGTNGGMIIVKEDGDIVCYHIFDRNDFRDFLYRNMKFETPDNSRYLSMSIIEDGDRYLVPLNVQIRMGQKKKEEAVITGYYDAESYGEKMIYHYQ